jgi:hypothetical protein
MLTWFRQTINDWFAHKQGEVFVFVSYDHEKSGRDEIGSYFKHPWANADESRATSNIWPFKSS